MVDNAASTPHEHSWLWVWGTMKFETGLIYDYFRCAECLKKRVRTTYLGTTEVKEDRVYEENIPFH